MIKTKIVWAKQYGTETKFGIITIIKMVII